MVLQVVVLIVFLFILSFTIAALSMAPWVPMWKKDLDRVFALANIQSGERFYDLGCGNGKVVLAAAQRYDITAVGVELAFPLYIVCVARKLFTRTKNATFVFGNLFSQDLSSADVIYVFGMPKKLEGRLVKKLYTEATPGTRVISYTFPIRGLEPLTVDKPSEDRISIYLYQL